MSVAKIWDPATSSWVTVAAGPTIAQHNALANRVSSLESVQSEKRGQLLDVQRVRSTGTTYRAMGAAGVYQFQLTDSGSSPAQVTYTPDQDCWWEVQSNVGIFRTSTAAYVYAYAYLQLTPSDVDGSTYDSQSFQIGMQHQAVDVYMHRAPEFTFKLAADITYTCKLMASVASGTWDYHVGAGMINMVGKAYSRASVGF